MKKRVSNCYVDGELGSTCSNFSPAAFMVAMSNRKRAIAAANGFLSTPCIEDRARAICSQRSTSGLPPPILQESVECAEQEVARAACRIDDAQDARQVRRARADRGQAELFDGRVEGVVEDELLDELGGLQQGVGLLGCLGEVLVEVAEEAGVPVGVGEVVDDLAVLAAAAPEGQQVLGGLVGGGDRPHGVVGLIEEAGRHLGYRQRLDALKDPVPVGLLRMLGEELLLAFAAMASRSPGPARTGRSISSLSSQNRMNTVARIHATAAWVTRSSSQLS